MTSEWMKLSFQTRMSFSKPECPCHLPLCQVLDAHPLYSCLCVLRGARARPHRTWRERLTLWYIHVRAGQTSVNVTRERTHTSCVETSPTQRVADCAYSVQLRQL